MNHETNAAYGHKALNDGYLDLPVLFVHARYDSICETVHSRLAEPMRKYCRNLSEEIIRAGHWVAQEKPLEVNAALVKWLAPASSACGLVQLELRRKMGALTDKYCIVGVGETPHMRPSNRTTLSMAVRGD